MSSVRSSHQRRHDHGDKGDDQQSATRGESSIPPAEHDSETAGDVESDALARYCFRTPRNYTYSYYNKCTLLSHNI